MPSTVLGQYGMSLPADTTGNRPASPTAGMVRQNTTHGCMEFYDGTSWILSGFPGDSAANPASSAVQLYNFGLRGKGFFWLLSPNGGTVLNFCDLDTVDENGVAGWILVAQFPYSSNWRYDSTTTRATLDPYDNSINESGQNDYYTRRWSANWGDYTMNRFRIHNSESINLTAGNAQADWYFHYSTACKWKEVWSWANGNYNYMNDASGDNNGNINAPFHSGWPAPVNAGNATPRCCLRGFNWAYNLKFSYQVAQRWNNLSDGAGAGTAQVGYNYWDGLTNPDRTLYWNAGDPDGTLGILPQGSTSTTASHDCNENNAKFGYDDGTECAMWSSTATNSTGQTGVTSVRRKLWFWIK